MLTSTAIAAAAAAVVTAATKSFGKRVVFALFLFTSCQKPCYQWHFDKSLACSPSLHSGRIWFATGDCSAGMTFEILRNNEGWWGYLSLCMFSFPEEGTCDGLPLTHISISIGDELYPYTAYLLTGSQRLLLPEEATFQIIDTLMNGNQVVVTAGCHSATLLPMRFEKAYHDLSKIPFSSLNTLDSTEVRHLPHGDPCG